MADLAILGISIHAGYATQKCVSNRTAHAWCVVF